MVYVLSTLGATKGCKGFHYGVTVAIQCLLLLLVNLIQLTLLQINRPRPLQLGRPLESVRY